MGGAVGVAVHYRRAERSLSRRAHGNVYVLPASTGDLLILTGTGIDIWDAFAGPRAIEDIVNRLSSRYGVPDSVVAADVVATVADLVKRHVLVDA